MTTLTKLKYPYFLSAAGLVLVALAGLYRLILASFIRRPVIRRLTFFPANVTRTVHPSYMFVGYRGFPLFALVLPTFVTVIGFVMIFLGLVWLGVLIFRESSSSKAP
jgi:hypothetical protein